MSVLDADAVRECKNTLYGSSESLGPQCRWIAETLVHHHKLHIKL